MKAKLIAVGLTAVLAAALSAATPAGAAAAKPKVLATDPADDWGANVEASLAPVGDGLGQELVEVAMPARQEEPQLHLHAEQPPAERWGTRVLALQLGLHGQQQPDPAVGRIHGVPPRHL